ncbi:hypothetical protein [Halomonas urumqiensis]|uniref:Uncharacterized protein n=1 Tax=Halomonas urumqiensis TaxID=1684789 RepID=A0A2N7UD36_9GAMM|nr:hypothetical protein [Halomonas urumqiensis]PMR78301.1 hypothetical protein C1H70_16195 [Halomonas urumqiensis]PTB03448.1 hypothetical protein C6V82_02830 [Halomonas urumqiensis]GHE20369.1 hypothetical protein GCM10017767_08900 [Halomonas urumqiensis]
MSLSIDRLELTLPASLGRRKHAIHRLLRQELAKLDWPAGDWPTMVVPTINLAYGSTNLGVARQLARQLHGQAWQYSNGLYSKGQYSNGQYSKGMPSAAGSALPGARSSRHGGDA